MAREDRDVADEMQRILSEEGVQFLTSAEAFSVRGRSGEQVNVTVRTPAGEQGHRGQRHPPCGAGTEHRRDRA